MKQAPNYWVLVVAAGSGKRMGADRPKQYLPIAGRMLIEYTLEQLLRLPNLKGLSLVLAADDAVGRNLACVASGRVDVILGGAERADSVLAGLHGLAQRARDDDWVLVHDAARPCIRLDDIEKLQQSLADDPVGGILAVPVTDTIKRASLSNANNIEQTLDRTALWRALTPQMFRLGALIDALEQAKRDQLDVTDEASAMELAGLKPQLISGHSDNIKVTRPEDLPVAELFLRQQGRII